jgi:hypothetical protein
MRRQYCFPCQRDTGHRRVYGRRTFYIVLLTGGLWLLALPFYPRRCVRCGRRRGERERLVRAVPPVDATAAESSQGTPRQSSQRRRRRRRGG